MPSEQRRDPSLEVLVERFDGFAKLVEQRFDDLDGRLDRMDFVAAALYAGDRLADSERHKALVGRVERIERGVSRAFWTAVGSVLAPIVVGVFVYLLIGSK